MNDNLNNLDGLNVDQNLKNDAQIGGRVPQKYKDFIDGLYKDSEGKVRVGESFPGAIKKLIDAYQAQPIAGSSDFSFDEDIKSLNNFVINVGNVLNGLQTKVKQYTDNRINDANSKLEAKDDVLKNAEITYNEALLEVKEERDFLNSKVEQLENELTGMRNNIDMFQNKIQDTDDLLAERDNYIESLELQTKEYATRAIEQQEKINSLLPMEAKNTELTQEITKLNTDIIKLNAEIQSEQNKVSSLEDKNKSLLSQIETKDSKITKYENTIDDLNKKLTSAKQDYNSVNIKVELLENENKSLNEQINAKSTLIDTLNMKITDAAVEKTNAVAEALAKAKEERDKKLDELREQIFKLEKELESKDTKDK